MKSLSALTATIAAATPAHAAVANAAETSLLMPAFFGFVALIVVFQAVPAFLLFIGMLKGLFAQNSRSTTPVQAERSRRG